MPLGRDQNIVPVLTFHSVGMRHDAWIWKHLSERAEIFERTIRRLKNSGYQTVTLGQLFDHMSGKKACPPKSIVLVFDDGYLDNWVTVYPLLKKYDMCGAVYVNPEFIDPSERVRPTIDEADLSTSSPQEMQQTGFMSWEELKIADDEGILDVQSHSLTHTWYFAGPKIVDCHSTETAHLYPWMQWNVRPDRKPYYLQEDQSEFVPAGTPVFEHEKSLLVHRYFPDEELVQAIVERYDEIADQRFIDISDRLSVYSEMVANVVGPGLFPGRIETDIEHHQRVRDELALSKSIIEQKLNKKVDYICWPGGGVDDLVKNVALEVGYKSWTLPSREQASKRNLPNSGPIEIRRLPAVRDIFFLGRTWGTGSETHTLLEIFAHQNSSIYDLLRKTYKAIFALRKLGAG